MVTSSIEASPYALAAADDSTVKRGDGVDDRQRGGSSYLEILKSSILVGGSSVVALMIGLLRTKAMAVLLGPAGFGLMGALTAIADLARSVADLGVTRSGVRQIAESVATGDTKRIGSTVKTLRWVALALAIVGSCLLAFGSGFISELTFGNAHHASGIALLSVAVLLRIVSDGQGAILQGTRRIADLARINIYGAALGVLTGVTLIYWYRENGVAPALVAAAAGSLIVSWWYCRRVKIEPLPLDAHAMGNEARALLRVGVAFMGSGLLMMGSAYLVRLVVIRHDGLIAAGLYQSAWAIGGIYVGLVLQAMGTDFYPRLVAVANDHPTCNRLANEQAEVSILLAAPGVIGTIAIAPVVLTLLYSAEFVQATETLRWICLGMALRVVTWPIGYIIVAKAENLYFVSTETAWAIFNVTLTVVLVNRLGVAGAGISFFLSYILHGLIIYPSVRRITGFRWARAVVRVALVQFALIASAFVASMTLQLAASAAIGLLLCAASCAYSLRTLSNLFTHGVPAGRLGKLIAFCRGSQKNA